jgi:hypothetical protein
MQDGLAVANHFLPKTNPLNNLPACFCRLWHLNNALLGYAKSLGAMRRSFNARTALPRSKGRRGRCCATF